MIDRGKAEGITFRDLTRIRAPPIETMTYSAEQLLTEDEIRRLIEACQSSRDRAFIATLYEGGFRPRELADRHFFSFRHFGDIFSIHRDKPAQTDNNPFTI